jgi:hypothetical protein
MMMVTPMAAKRIPTMSSTPNWNLEMTAKTIAARKLTPAAAVIMEIFEQSQIY